VVPVVTGFIGATLERVPTTLGRGGSDYSATILGAALGAQETVIWTDVDGVKTADPKLVPEARTIDEISYNEAAELAYFGANVLFVSQSSSQNDICFVISSSDEKRTVEALRHAFAPEIAEQTVEHVSSNSRIAIVAVVGENMHGIPGIAGRTFSALGREGINIIAIAQGSSEYNISLVVEADAMQRA